MVKVDPAVVKCNCSRPPPSCFRAGGAGKVSSSALRSLLRLCDSQSAVGMAFDPISFKNTKHIMRAAEFLRDLVLKGHVILKHVPGTLMIADILTKAPARATFIELVKLLDDYSRTP